MPLLVCGYIVNCGPGYTIEMFSKGWTKGARLNYAQQLNLWTSTVKVWAANLRLSA